ncbi:membrane-associated protein, putative [Bodo saltans]|uniref:Membrane-associated protein, putative n=1 Tax=Bodo saltans TaxID=75058 RepID=A0A0S4JBX7_BODSA|nr:membrane-associated protein, putative [Bodo saltans]|eukprot:CUG86361.1 membrane-associated protein, putative [Bodo saltans]
MPSDGGTCFVLLVTLCVANFVLVAAMLALRPYNSHPDFALSVAACGVGAFSGVASLVEDDEAAATLALIGVWLALVLLLLQMLLTPRAARGFRRLQRHVLRVVDGTMWVPQAQYVPIARKAETSPQLNFDFSNDLQVDEPRETDEKIGRREASMSRRIELE